MSDDAVSPVVGVILVVAITVILSAVVGMAVLQMGNSPDGSTPNPVGVSIKTDGSGVATVTLYDRANAEYVLVQNSTGANKTLTNVGDAVTIVTNGEPITIISVRGGKQNVVVRHTTGESVGSNTPGFSPILVDDVEDGSLSEYQDELEDASVETTVVQSGSASVNIASKSADKYNGIVSASGLNAYPQAGDEFEAHVYHSSTSSTSFIYFGMQSTVNGAYGYHLILDDAASIFKIRATNASGNFDIDSVSVSIPESEWLYVTVTWGADGTISATLYDSTGTPLGSISGSDAQYTSGGFGFGHYHPSGGTSVYFDEVYIISQTP